jgi:hypothetical protein
VHVLGPVGRVYGWLTSSLSIGSIPPAVGIVICSMSTIFLPVPIRSW